ncbi:lipoprotein signal peptidase [Anaerocolumna cellulosilytica]|uniref:Lipoprotein signal peptidase n=1 Tax=Anaerocolumna cellulosilytica TaxID=433286 RepID=A0A6S6R7T2_9FIRM|nr:signal peptidase II [Anaerocolumna cellulosilytica]MBB5193762.1 signal peptidase II [Anaerocolumna cellulosilytica]BCJ95021.1 lipoprotein signal peptidase [Anaerocolumna cellulosilytica]
MKKLRHLFYIFLLLGFDQLTKYLVVTKLKGKDPFQIISGVLQLRYHENDGAVWGIMSGKIGFLVVLTLVIMAGMVFFYLKIPAKKQYDALRIVLIFIGAGAIGNFIDRILRNFVVDFIYFELIDFPIFNVADMYITCSAALLIILSIFYYKDEDFDFLSKKKEEGHE